MYLYRSNPCCHHDTDEDRHKKRYLVTATKATRVVQQFGNENKTIKTKVTLWSAIRIQQ